MKLNNFLIKLKYLFFILFIAKYRQNPYHCHFQVTRKCNFRCISCCVWKDNTDQNELTLEEIKVASSKLKELGIKSISITGGEPLLRNDIVEIIDIFKKDGFIIRLQTNGLLLNEILLNKMLEKGLDDIYISLDTLNNDTFMFINGVNKDNIFNIVINNVKTVSKISKKYNVGLILTTILRSENLDEIEALSKFAKDQQCLIGFYGLEVAKFEDSATIRSSNVNLIPDEKKKKQLIQAFEKVINYKNLNKYPIIQSNKLLKDYIEFYGKDSNNMKWNCNAGRYYIELLSDGKISICNGVPTFEDYDYKNINDLYKLNSRNKLFSEYKAKCNGCICTRQLEYMINDFSDIREKLFQYLKAVVIKK